MSDETKHKISVSHKGNKYSLGHKHSEETKQKMRDRWKETHPFTVLIDEQFEGKCYLQSSKGG